MSQVIISSEGNLLMRNFPSPTVATPQLRSDWSFRFPGNHFRPRAQPATRKGETAAAAAAFLLLQAGKVRVGDGVGVGISSSASARVIAVALLLLLLLFFSCDLNSYFLSSWHKFEAKFALDSPGMSCRVFGVRCELCLLWLVRWTLSRAGCVSCAVAVLLFSCSAMALSFFVASSTQSATVAAGGGSQR